MGTTWSARRQPPPDASGLVDRGAEAWAAMRANPVKADPTLGPIQTPSTSVTADKPKPRTKRMRTY